MYSSGSLMKSANLFDLSCQGRRPRWQSRLARPWSWYWPVDVRSYRYNWLEACMVLVLPTTGVEENLECGRKKSTSPLFLRGADEERLFISGFRNFLSHTIHRIRIWRCCQVPGSDFTCILTCRTEPTRPTNQSLEKKLIADRDDLTERALLQ